MNASKWLVQLVLLISLAAPGWAANHYVRAAASGSADGSDWTNACTDFTGSCAVASLVRGDTYYVGTGTYGSRTFNTAVSGTLVITIRGATASEHGTDTGWQASYGVDVAQATFGTGMVIARSYITFDGAVGPVWSGSAAAYGFRIALPSNCSADQLGMQIIDVTPAVISNVTVKRVSWLGCGPSFDGFRQQGIYVGANVGIGDDSTQDITISTLYLDDGITPLIVDRAVRVTVEYVFIDDNWSGVFHGVSVQNRNVDDVIYRYNRIENSTGTGGICGYDNFIRNVKIYANLFVANGGGNGLICSGDGGSVGLDGWLVYNNTIVDAPANFFFSTHASTANNFIRNNLLYKSEPFISATAGITHEYNTYLDSLNTPESEPNGQIDTFNPFVNYASGNYHLANGTSVDAGLSLGSPYSSDPDGLTRGGDGKWDRGIYEFSAGQPRSFHYQPIRSTVRLALFLATLALAAITYRRWVTQPDTAAPCKVKTS